MGTLQLISPICLFDFPCRCRVPSIFGKCCAAKYLAPCWSQSRATSQVHCMRQKQMSKLSSVSALLGKICASSALILQATYEEIIFILSNKTLKLVEAVDAWKVCKDWPLFKPRENSANPIWKRSCGSDTGVGGNLAAASAGAVPRAGLDPLLSVPSTKTSRKIAFPRLLWHDINELRRDCL